MKSFLCSRTIPLILFFLLTIMSGYSYAQTYTLNGRITDERNRQPLAFVNVVINDGQVGTISDIDGKYSIESTQPIHKVQFSSIGYETKEVLLTEGMKKSNVRLTPKTFELHEVTVNAGENPAHRIIDSLLSHPFDALCIPRFGLLQRTKEHFIETERVGTVFLHEVVGVLHVVFRLRHLLHLS